ncbi:histidine phosphatase family protein [Rhodoferax koreense]|uniref:Histidine phosphatase family protein n=1 Tax=Rhodoferax koreensis TaxID=1842727 RepID=A0A1P8K486_9BURK|nr:histidine phosphatase family protein [Rhodoferax koreense]APW40808.1 histidine phosphatase family protein [Rhodoferax koreense]
MHPQAIFITHPNVVISREVPVPRWPLSALGRERMTSGLRQPWLAEVRALACSSEQKAIDGAQILAQHLGLSIIQDAGLDENDRSATGFLPPPAFEAMADAFFAEPERSVRGWERAVDAQARVVAAVTRLLAAHRSQGETGALAIVSHGAVGTLLYCHLAGVPIDRRWDQPPNGGGNYFRFSLSPRAVDGWWRAFDAVD